MALNNDQIICKLLKDEWSALKNMIEAEAKILRAIYDRIKAITSRLKNIIIRRVVGLIYEIFKVIRGMLGLDTITNNLARDKWCQVMYQCQPMIVKLSKLIGQDFFTWLYGPDDITTLDLSKYGIPKQHFTSKYEAYEFVACRLSLRGLLDGVAKDTAEWVTSYLERLLEYLDLEYWLKRTTYGRKINNLIRYYERLFEFIKPYLEELEKYMNCTFALCDFGASSNNFADDFCQRYSIGREKNSAGKIKWTVLKDDITKDLSNHMKGVKKEIEDFQKKGTTVAEKTNALFGKKEEDIEVEETNPETKEEVEAKLYQRNERTNISTPTLATGLNTTKSRKTITITSPSSGDVA